MTALIASYLLPDSLCQRFGSSLSSDRIHQSSANVSETGAQPKSVCFNYCFPLSSCRHTHLEAYHLGQSSPPSPSPPLPMTLVVRRKRARRPAPLSRAPLPPQLQTQQHNSSPRRLATERAALLRSPPPLRLVSCDCCDGRTAPVAAKTCPPMRSSSRRRSHPQG